MTFSSDLSKMTSFYWWDAG